MKTFRFEYSFPMCSCYTEPDIRYMAARSRTLTFNKEKFMANSHWMGVDPFDHFSYKCEPLDAKLIDIIERRHWTPDCVNPFKTLGTHIGTAQYTMNRYRFCARAENSYTIVFTLRAFFAGRDTDRRQYAVNECCDKTCLVCGVEFDELEGDIVTFNDNLRTEGLCYSCLEAMYGETCGGYGGFHRYYKRVTDEELPKFLLKIMARQKVIGYQSEAA